MGPITRGCYTARLLGGDADLRAAQALRHLAFRGGAGLDADGFDPLCRHLVVEGPGGALLACARLQAFDAASDLGASYTAQFYDLGRTALYPGPKLELGRFCLHPAAHDPDILRLAWGALTALVDAEGVTLLFGCTSFHGADPAAHGPALAALRRHVAPEACRPGPRAACRVDLPEAGGDATRLPPLMRSYLAMGGWVSDHAVIDADLDTLHVCTLMPVANVPPARARALRAVAMGR